MNKLFLVAFLCFTIACKESSKQEHFQGNLVINDSLSIPFDINYNGFTKTYAIQNGLEIIAELKHSVVNDSTDLEHPVFNSNLRFVREGDTLKGSWYNREKRNYQMAFVAFKDQERVAHSYPSSDPSGRWAVTFSSEPNDTSVGVFEMENELVQGTFLTPTGDYRYLKGAVNGDQLVLSTFDFSHAYLFISTFSLQGMKGEFYSGSHWKENWTAVRNEEIELKSALDTNALADSLTSFQITGLSGELIDKNHPLFEGKPIVIQLFGSWCPNCYDESKYLNVLHKEYQDQVTVLGVGFERAENLEDAIEKIEKFRSGLSIDYHLAYGGPAVKDSAQAHFPFLDKVVAFPTLLFFNKNHGLIAIHSGFNGPGTGKEYLKTKKEIRTLFELLTQE